MIGSKNGVPRRRQRTILTDGPHPVDVHVGARIRHQRALAGLNQSQLAQKVGVTFQSIQKYERGSNRVSASRLQEIASVLGVPVSHFFEGLTESEPQLAPPGDLTAREIHELNSAFAAVKDKTVRRAFLLLLRNAAGLNGSDDGGASPPN